MSSSLPVFLARPLIELWLELSPLSWRRQVVASDSPHVHSPGMNPDRVLVTGDGVATGRGVLTHDLGLPGHLARALSAVTGNATDVDAVVHQDMTVRSCPRAILGIDLFRYDIIVLSMGHNEALALMDTATWGTGLHDFLATLVDSAPVDTRIFLLSIPLFGPGTPLPAALSHIVDRHAAELNAVTASVVEGLPSVTLIPVHDTNEFQPENVHRYRKWADSIAARISEVLDPDRVPAGDTASPDEIARQQALEDLETLGTGIDPVLDHLTDTARQAFGTPMAAITFIRSDTQIMAVMKGLEPVVLPRDETFCDVTIRKSRHLVIEDTTTDSRYASFSVVAGSPGMRSYAGYPIESPDGHRVGAFCVMDTEPRRFTPNDITLLRSLAHLVQEHLWQNREP